jgi:hypothetical protein
MIAKVVVDFVGHNHIPLGDKLVARYGLLEERMELEWVIVIG